MCSLLIVSYFLCLILELITCLPLYMPQLAQTVWGLTGWRQLGQIDRLLVLSLILALLLP